MRDRMRLKLIFDRKILIIFSLSLFFFSGGRRGVLHIFIFTPPPIYFEMKPPVQRTSILGDSTIHIYPLCSYKFISGGCKYHLDDFRLE